MCAACVAQGIAYVGGAVGGLQVMAARAKARRRSNEPQQDEEATSPERSDEPAPT
jgi:hypothetical protein